VTRASIIVVLLVGCASRRLPMQCPDDGPTKNDYLEDKTYDRYEVEGDHPDTYLANARAQRPFSRDDTSSHGVGLTESKSCLHWQLVHDSGSCRIGAVRLVHKVRITLPKWKRPKNASPEFVRWDEQTSAQLAQHEEGHYLIATAFSRGLYERALAITTAPTCEELDRQFGELLKSGNAELLQKQAEYDAATKHGTAMN
jgi:predicted secreted Zn-dependent protease